MIHHILCISICLHALKKNGGSQGDAQGTLFDDMDNHTVCQCRRNAGKNDWPVAVYFPALSLPIGTNKTESHM